MYGKEFVVTKHFIKKLYVVNGKLNKGQSNNAGTMLTLLLVTSSCYRAQADNFFMNTIYRQTLCETDQSEYEI